MEDELNLTCLECRHGEHGQVSCASGIRARMEQHLKLYHPLIYLSEKDFTKMVYERRESVSI